MYIKDTIFRPVFSFFYKQIAKSNLLTSFIVVIKVQCNAIIRYHFSSTHHLDINGEDLVMNTIAPLCKHVFDVGANKGEYTEKFTQVNKLAQLYLYEPSVEASGLLVKKFSKFENVVINQKALADFTGEHDFYEEPGAGETSSLIEGFSVDSNVKKTVSVSTIDNEIKRWNLGKIDFVKCDCEGYDFNVIKGADQSLRENKIDFFQFEYNLPWSYIGSTLFAAIKKFKDYNYSVYLVQPDGLYDFDYAKYGEYFSYSNYLAVLNTKVESIENILKHKTF